MLPTLWAQNYKCKGAKLKQELPPESLKKPRRWPSVNEKEKCCEINGIHKKSKEATKELRIFWLKIKQFHYVKT